MNSPILVWMLYLNREVSTEVCSFPFFLFLSGDLSPRPRNMKSATSSYTTPSPMQRTFPQTHRLANHYVRSTLFPSSHNYLNLGPLAGQIIAQMMPLLMMRHRRIPRARWRDHSTHNGKHWIEQVRFCEIYLFLLILVFFFLSLKNENVAQMLDHVNPEHHLRSMIGYHLAWENSLVGMVMVQGKQREVVNIGLGVKQVAVEPRDATVSAYVESLSHKVCVYFQQKKQRILNRPH
jgi:4'-phosphopantetheinyl transferase